MSDSESSQCSLDFLPDVDTSSTQPTKKYKHQHPDPVDDTLVECEPEDEMEWCASVLSSHRSTPAQKKDIYLMIFNFACCKTFEYLAQEVKRLHAKERYLILDNELRNFFVTYPKKQEARETILKSFPEYAWPEGFLEFVSDYLNKSVTKEFTNSNTWTAGLSEEELRQVYTGHLIEYQVKTVAAPVNNALNPLWQPLPSGVQDSTPLRHYVRRKLWHKHCLDLSKSYLKVKLGQKPKKAETRLVLTEEYTKEDALEEIYLKRMHNMTLEWRPKCWLTFIFMGRPAGDRMSYLFSSGSPSKAMPYGISPSEAALSIGGREARRHLHESVGRGFGKRNPRKMRPRPTSPDTFSATTTDLNADSIIKKS